MEEATGIEPAYWRDYGMSYGMEGLYDEVSWSMPFQQDVPAPRVAGIMGCARPSLGAMLAETGCLTYPAFGAKAARHTLL